MGNLDFNADEHDDPISFDVMPDNTLLVTGVDLAAGRNGARRRD